MSTTLKFLTLISFFAFLTSCTTEQNDTEELACSAATGVWYLQSSTCNGVSQSLASVQLDFSSGTQTVQTMGPSACQTQRTFDYAAGSAAPMLEQTGVGNWVCLNGGSSVSSCSEPENSCNNSTSNVGDENDFDSCAILNGVMTVSRTTDSQHVSASLSPCTSGDTEVHTFSQTPPTSPPGTPAVLTISDGPTYDYGTVGVGSSSQHTFTVTNSGGESATAISETGLATPYRFLGGTYPGTGGTCSATLAAGANCVIVVEFNPLSIGLFADSIELNYNDSVAAQVASRDIQGTGNNLALLVISETDPYDYGSVQNGFTNNHTFTIVNTGASVAFAISGSGLAAPFSFMGGGYPGVGGTCGATLAAAANCTIVVEFAPTSIGVFADTIIIDYNDGATLQQATRDVTGTGIP